MEENNDLTEPEDRFCPICDDKIEKGVPLHRCSEKKIKMIDKKDKTKEPNEDKSYNDKLRDFDRFYNQETYYKEEENEVDNV
ncbi:MAG: hypothetical protein ACTSSP_00140 [Candidatus Asgardarchaeia archaeon]